MTQTQRRPGSVARGATQLGFDAIAELSRVVEAMHANIAAAPAPLGRGTDGRARGISGLVYESVRLASDAAGFGVDRMLELLERPAAAHTPRSQARWDGVLGVLNGVLGDHLAERANPLAIPMQLRRNAQSIAPGSSGGRKLLLLVHGLCMNDLRWQRNGHDHGAELARDLGYTPLYLLYNSGRHVSQNGRELAALLERHVVASPTPVEELAILGHSLGGLVARSACQIASEQQLTWPRRLRRIVFLGTPHHGAPLERIGSHAHGLAELSPYVAPLARLARIRSAAITDLRHGSLLDRDWQGKDPFARSRDLPCPVPLPEGVACYALAGTLAPRPGLPGTGLLGDGLVPLESALGQHRDATRALDFPESRRWVGAGLGHFDLLDRPEVYEVIRRRLSQEPA